MLPGIDSMFNMLDKVMEEEDKNLSDKEKEIISSLKTVMKKIGETDEEDMSSKVSKDLMDIVKEFEKDMKG